jgi:hypothetical protein
LIARTFARQIGEGKTSEKLEAANYAPCGKLSQAGGGKKRRVVQRSIFD